jgi:hypothetical protein
MGPDGSGALVEQGMDAATGLGKLIWAPAARSWLRLAAV